MPPDFYVISKLRKRQMTDQEFIRIDASRTVGNKETYIKKSAVTGFQEDKAKDSTGQIVNIVNVYLAAESWQFKMELSEFKNLMNVVN